MSIVAWLKLIFPLVSEYLKEVLFPGKDANKTTPLERVSILVIVLLIAMIAFLGDNFFKMYEEKQTLKTEVTKKELKIDSMQRELDSVNSDLSILERKCETTNKTPPYDGRTTPVKVAREEDISIGDRLRIINDINGS